MQHFKQRWPFFLFGLIIGIAFVVYFWSKKDTEFNYGPKARFLNNIKNKELIISKKVCDFLLEKSLDESLVLEMIAHGRIDFWNKKKVGNNCIEYKIIGVNSLKNFLLILKNCEHHARILDFADEVI